MVPGNKKEAGVIHLSLLKKHPKQRTVKFLGNRLNGELLSNEVQRDGQHQADNDRTPQ